MDPTGPTETALTDEEKSQHALKYLIESLGKPGFMPEDIAFLIQHTEFEHRPVGIREFVESPQYLNAKDECWPAVLSDLEEIFPQSLLYSKKFSPFTEVFRDMGIGSGKSFRIRYMFCYVAYRLLCFKDPQAAYGLAKDSTIALVNASVTAQQAKKIIFADVIVAIKNSPWFQAHGQPNPNVLSEMQLPKNLVIFPGSSSETAPIGYNIFFSNVDEAAFFVDSDTTDAAQNIHDAMVDRRKSRFDENGLNAAISSPRYVDDFIERKVEESERSPHMSGKIAPTWENRPRDVAAIAAGDFFELEHPRTRELVKIPNAYKESFDKNPQKAWRNFGAVASLALEPYMAYHEIEMLERIMAANNPTPISGAGWHPGFQPQGFHYFVHFDLAVKRDACGMAVGHPDGRGGVVIDAVVRIMSAMRAAEVRSKNQVVDLVSGNDQVQLEEVRQLVYALSTRGFFIHTVSYDQFQSVDSRQILESKGYLTKLISTDKDLKAYDTFKDFLNTSRFSCCAHPHFLLECRRLELKEGKKVDHPPNGSKDCADGVAGVCRSIAESFDEIIEEEETVVEEPPENVRFIQENI